MSHDDLLEKVERLQNICVSRATGGGDDAQYVQLRDQLQKNTRIAGALPRFIRTCRDSFQFWQFIKYKFPSYQERRDYIWEEFRPLLQDLETGSNPAERTTTELLGDVSDGAIHDVWERAMSRRIDDPEGAITTARTLLETVCKHILEIDKIDFADDADLPKLYRLTAEHLSIAPSQHSAQVFKQILGGCTAVIEGLGALRNRLGDAHGKTSRNVRPTARHAQLAVNLAGTMATFLLATWEARRSPR